MIELQQTTQLKHAMSASSKALHSAAESAEDAAVAKLGMIPSAAKQILQTLATQHSCKCQPIYSSSHVQQLLQPCLNAFCQPQAAGLTGSAAAVNGRLPTVNGSPPAAKGNTPVAKGSLAAVKGSTPRTKGAMMSSERQCQPIDLEVLDQLPDAADLSAHDWQMLR